MVPVHIPIIDEVALALAADYVRDGEFCDSDLAFDPAEKTATLAVWKHDDTLSKLRTDESRNWYELPMRCLEISFKKVDAVKIDRNHAKTGRHPVGGLRWDGRGIISIDTYDGLTIKLTANPLVGHLLITNKTREPGGG